MHEIQLSVVIPTYNRKGILKSCLEALFNQDISHDRYEILVVDDDSDDGTEQMMKKMLKEAPALLRYFRQEKKGPAAAKNIGIKNSRGEIVLFINDDIIVTPSLIQEHIKSHRKSPDPRIAVLGYVTWHPEIKVTPLMDWLENGGPQFDYDGIESDKTDWKRFYTCNISLKKDFLINNGLFDEDFPHASFEDIELGYRLAKKRLVILYNKNAMGYHYHKIDSIQAYCEHRKKIIGKSHWLLYQKQPALKYSEAYTDVCIRGFCSTAKKIKSYIEKTMESTKEIEKALNFLPIRYRDTSRNFLYSYYLILTDHYFILGTAEEMKKDIPNFNKLSHLCFKGAEKEGQGNFTLALQKYKEAKKLSLGFPPVIYLMARCYEKIGEFNKSNKLYTDILKREESNQYIRLLLTLNYRRQKRFITSIREFKKILVCELIDRNFSAVVHYHFGSLLKEMNLLDKSKREFKKVIQLCTDNGLKLKDFKSGAHFHLGEIFLATGNTAKAKDQFLNCLEINPEHKTSLRSLSRILKNRAQKSVDKEILAAS